MLTEVLRKGAKRLLAEAVEAKVERWLEERKEILDEKGHKQVVRNGYMPERTVLTGIGPIEIEKPRVRDRRP